LTGEQIRDADHIWWKGPEWLKDSPDKWPRWNGKDGYYDDLLTHETDEERDRREAEEALVVTAVVPLPVEEPLGPVDVTRYSTLTKLLRVTAVVIRAGRRWRMKMQRRKGKSVLRLNELNEMQIYSGPSIWPEEMAKAMQHLIRQHQSKYFHKLDAMKE